MHFDAEHAATFLGALSGSDGWTTPVSFQTLDDRKSGRSDLIRCLHTSLRVAAGTLAHLNAEGAGIFVTVNTTNGRGRKAADIVALRALFIDEDGPSKAALKLPPSIVVRSARGSHVYWLLKRGEEQEAFTAGQRHLARFYGTDPTVCDLPRVMRLPGSMHQKANAVFVTLQEVHGDRRYSIDEILAAHPIKRTRKRALRPVVDLRSLDETAQLDALNGYVGWVMARSHAPGKRNTTAFQIAAEGLRRGIPEHLIARMVSDYCGQAGIAAEAESVLRSAAAYHARRQLA